MFQRALHCANMKFYSLKTIVVSTRHWLAKINQNKLTAHIFQLLLNPFYGIFVPHRTTNHKSISFEHNTTSDGINWIHHYFHFCKHNGSLIFTLIKNFPSFIKIESLIFLFSQQFVIALCNITNIIKWILWNYYKIIIMLIQRIYWTNNCKKKRQKCI